MAESATQYQAADQLERVPVADPATAAVLARVADGAAPVVLRTQDGTETVVLSMAEYQRLCEYAVLREEPAPPCIEDLRARRDDILRLAAQRGASNVRVFGSVARGEARPDSDVDFLVELEPGRSLMDLGGLLMDLQDLLGRKVDVVEELGLRERVRNRIVKEAVPL